MESQLDNKTIKKVSHLKEKDSDLFKYILLEFTDGERRVIMSTPETENNSNPFTLDIFPVKEFEWILNKSLDTDFDTFELSKVV